MSTSVIANDGRTLRASRRRAERKEEILSVAQEVFGSRGYQATSVADVIEAAGISRGTFYLYFESLESLFHEILDRFIKRLTDSIQEVRPEDGRPIEDLYENVFRVVDLLIQNRNITIILFREAIGVNATVDQKLNELNTFLLQKLTSALHQGIEWKILRPLNEKIIATMVIGGIKEILYQALVVNRNGDPDPQVIAREILQFGIQGLQK